MTQETTIIHTKTIFTNDKSIYMCDGGWSMTSVDSVDEIIKEYGYINFKPPANEEWSVYCLEDTTIIKLKLIPLKFLKPDKDYVLESSILVAVFSQSELKGPPSTVPLPMTDANKTKAVDKMDMKFKTVDEPWNEYTLDDGNKISIKSVATSISSTSLFDARGEPVYLVNHQSLVKKYPPV